MRRLVGCVLVLGCAGGTDGVDSDSDPGEVTPVEVTEASFPCVTDMSPVRRFYVDNLLGDVDATLAVANSADGGTWPVGSLVQLVPTEAMVKREPGFSPASNDWEFFSLSVSADGTTIEARGKEDVDNAFGLNCFACHAQADAKWDLICEQDHGCDPLPIGEEFIRNVQDNDPRCGA